jgi:hypothetical protein
MRLFAVLRLHAMSWKRSSRVDQINFQANFLGTHHKTQKVPTRASYLTFKYAVGSRLTNALILAAMVMNPESRCICFEQYAVEVQKCRIEQAESSFSTETLPHRHNATQEILLPTDNLHREAFFCI